MSETRQIGSGPFDEQLTAPTGTAYLLAIGIDAYTSCPPLHNAASDVRSFVQILTSKYQFEAGNVTWLLNQDATRSKIHRSLRHLAQTVTAEDSLLIYYAGHGSYDRVMDKGYWVPVDGILHDPSSYYSSDEIIGAVRMIKSHHTLIISDSCFSGKLFATRDLMFDEYQETTPSRWMITSGRDEVVPDDGPFSSSLTKFLIRNTDRVVRCARLFEAITIPVVSNSWQRPRYEPLYGVNHEGGEFAFRLKNERDDDSDNHPQPRRASDSAQNDAVRHLTPPSPTNGGGLQNLTRRLGGPAMAVLLLLAALLIVGTAVWSLTGGTGTEASKPDVPAQIMVDTAKNQPIAQLKPKREEKPQAVPPTAAPQNTTVSKPAGGKAASDSKGKTKPPEEILQPDVEPEQPAIKMCTVRCNTFGLSGVGVSFIHNGQKYPFKKEDDDTMSALVPCALTKGSSVFVTFTRNGKQDTRNIPLSDSRAFDIPAALRDE